MYKSNLVNIYRGFDNKPLNNAWEYERERLVLSPRTFNGVIKALMRLQKALAVTTGDGKTHISTVGQTDDGDRRWLSLCKVQAVN